MMKRRGGWSDGPACFLPKANVDGDVEAVGADGGMDVASRPDGGTRHDVLSWRAEPDGAWHA